jgi:hypothetical protein
VSAQVQANLARDRNGVASLRNVLGGTRIG